MRVLRAIEIALAVLLAGAGIWILASRPLDDRLDAMLPQDPELMRSMKLLEDAKLSGKVIVEVRNPSNAVPHDTFVEALNRLCNELPSPLVTRVVTPGGSMPAPEDLRAFATFAPQLLDPETYTELAARTGEEGVNQSLKGIRRTLMTPQSMAMAEWFRSDPFGARATALKPLQALGAAMGYRANIRDGHFFNEDLSAAMLILETPVRVTDHAGSAELMAFIRERLAKLPAGTESSVIAGHLHTLSNQRVIKRDIGWTSTLATVIFATLFLVHFRDLRSVLIFIIPTLGILMGIAVAGITGDRIVAIVVGMGGMLAGIAIDYGIHVYVALTRPEADRSRWDAVRLIRRTIWLSALTTVTPIAGLVFSTIPGYRQLGILSSAALICSLLLAIHALPYFFPRMLKAVQPRPHDPAVPGPAAPPRWAVPAFLAVLACGAALAFGVKVDLDFSRLDGTEKAIVEEEKSFFQRWGEGPASMGIVAVWDKDPEKARRANDAILRQIRAVPGAAESFFSIAAVAPSAETRGRNARAWLDFWERNGADLRERTARIAPSYGFATNAFEPFFASLRDGADPATFAPSNSLMASLERQFVRPLGDRFMVLSFFADTPTVAGALAGLRDIPAAYACVSRRTMKDAFSACIIKDLSRQALIGLTLIAILVVVLVRQPKAILLICIPPVAGVVGMLAGLRLAGQALTPVTMVAGLLLAGNCFDYAVFTLEAWRRNARDEIGRGVYLAWVTTAAGTALLLVAEHPVLFATGLALTIGVTCGFLAARWVVWPAAQMLRIPNTTACNAGQSMDGMHDSGRSPAVPGKPAPSQDE
jgi:predicted exporter